MITQKAKLSVRNNQLVVQQEDVVTIPLEDIATILIEDKTVTLTTSVLSQCAERNIALFVCDNKYLPNGILTSFQKHSRQITVLNQQLSLSKPFQKRVWQKLIIQKIKNQATCLHLLKKDGEQDLLAISKTVESGDTSNREAYASRIYFQKLFGKSYTRRSNNIYNNALNYGYSLLRGSTARALVNHGFLPCIGLNHHNELNQFNLADDFMEVFRPFIDYGIVLLIDKNDSFCKKTRAEIYNLLNHEVLMNENKISVHRAIEEMIKSYVSSIRFNDYQKLKLPELIPLSLHAYE